MEKISTKQELIEMVKDLISVETQAMKDYQEDVITFSNHKIKETIQQIKEDEIRHIK